MSWGKFSRLVSCLRSIPRRRSILAASISLSCTLHAVKDSNNVVTLGNTPRFANMVHHMRPKSAPCVSRGVWCRHQTRCAQQTYPKTFQINMLPSSPTDVSCLSSGLKLRTGTEEKGEGRKSGECHGVQRSLLNSDAHFCPRS